MPIQPKFTDAGQALQLRALAGEEIVFTKIQIGSGELGETSYKTFNALLDPKITVPITDISVSNGYAKIRGYFDNMNLDEGIYYREVGLFAKNPDDPTKEILYSYVNYGAEASYIADHTSKLIEHSVTFVAVVDDAANVSAVINGSAVYVDFTDMRKAIEEHNADGNAHPGMASQTLEVYVDCNSTEDDELCDGSYEHPFKNISSIEFKVPKHIKVLSIILKSTGDYVLESEPYFGYSDLEKISLVYNGNATHKPIINGSLCFGELDEVYIRNVDFLDDGRNWVSSTAKLWFDSCKNTFLSDVSAQCKVTDGCGFIESFNSTVYISQVSVLNMSSAVNAYNSSVVHILSGTFETLGVSINYDSSVIYAYTNEELTYEGVDGLVFTPETMEKITNGDILKHISSTANPHHVSLDDAQLQGGVIDVAHGGTGLESMTKGSLLVGNGTDVVNGVRGKGALYATTEGSPKFGTLPVNMGGTGATSIPYGSVVAGGSNGVSPIAPARGAFYGINTLQPPRYGTLPGDCGGTGFSELEDYTLLVGDSGSSVLKKLLLDKGALYNDTNFLRYGVLPPSCGGTGQSDIYYHYDESGATNYKARHVQFVIPGTDVLVWAGRIIVTAGNTFDCWLSWSGEKTFTDNSYALVLSKADINESEVTRYADHFHVDKQTIGDRVADFIAIGKVAS